MIIICSVCVTSVLYAARIKDIANIAGIRDNQLVGYGLVVGLDGTGDRVTQTPFTQQTFLNMLLEFGIRLPVGTNLQLKNVAAVALSANLPPFAKPGQRIDVTVASLGNATSIRGGELLLTALRGADGQTYANAQGSVVVSGFGALGADGSKVSVNVTSSGRIPNGATVEKVIDMPYVQEGSVTFELIQPDFSTVQKMETAINAEFGKRVATAVDGSSVRVKINNLLSDYSGFKQSPNVRLYKDEATSGGTAAPTHYYDDALMSKYVPIISRIENIQMDPAETRAKVIVNSRTGTIVVDANVSISPVAVSHGNLTVVVSERPYVSQPNAFANGKTVKGSASDININQQQNRAFVFAPGASLNDLVRAINDVGAAPGDVIAILEAIKSAGALHADLEII